MKLLTEHKYDGLYYRTPKRTATNVESLTRQLANTEVLTKIMIMLCISSQKVNLTKFTVK